MPRLLENNATTKQFRDKAIATIGGTPYRAIEVGIEVMLCQSIAAMVTKGKLVGMLPRVNPVTASRIEGGMIYGVYDATFPTTYGGA